MRFLCCSIINVLNFLFNKFISIIIELLKTYIWIGETVHLNRKMEIL